MDYERELRDTGDLIASEKYKQAVNTAGSTIEALLKDLYAELNNALAGTERARIQAALQSKHRDVKKVTFGQWVGFFGAEDLFRMLNEKLKYKLRFLNSGTLATVVGIRNDCTHEDYTPSRTDAETVRQFLAQYLIETNRAKPEEAAAVLPTPKEERAKGVLPSWTQIAAPNRDIRERRFDLGIFAIHLGEIAAESGSGQPEYADPAEFFDLTYITRGLRAQLVQMMGRLSGRGTGASVVQLDTTFGGGKTHTLLAMYHLAKHGYALKDREDVRSLTNEARVEEPPQAAVAVLDGSYLSPTKARITADGLTLKTLWGEMAYQLGGAKAYEFLRASDEAMSAPGSRDITEMLRALNKPVLILLDEVLDYATKAAGVKVGRGYLVEQVQSFIKALTQAVDPQPNALMVLTLTSSPQQIFGEAARRMQEELTRVQGTFKTILERVQRTEVTAESAEIYEILRRRLFEKVGTAEDHKRIADAYWKYYRENSSVFPQHVLEPSYRERITQSYPFHPDLIDVLRDRWGTIQGFQKTRGVLRLLALVVSSLYRKNHGAPLIHVGHIDLAEPEIRRELLGHVDSPAGYESAIGSDIAGLPESKAESVDQRIGGDYYRFGLCEGLGTALFMYSHMGAGGFIGGTKPQLWLGILQPDVIPALAADAYGKLEAALWYMEKEGALSRLGVDPNLNMMLVQRMDALRQDADKLGEIVYAAVESLAGTKFGKPIIWPEDSRLVRDNSALKLVVAPPDRWFREDDPEIRAQVFIDGILRSAGDKHRQFRNTVVFVLPTPDGYANMEQAAIRLIALEDIDTATGRTLKDHVREELRSQLAAARVGLPSAIWGAYIITATAGKNDDPWIVWESGIKPYRQNDTLAQRVWDRLTDGERLLEKFAVDHMMRRTDERFAGLWRADQDAVKTQDLWDAFARYDYLPMLASQRVLQETIAEGVQRGLFGYCTGSPSKPDKIYFDERMPADQFAISEFAWLLNAERARPLRYPPPPEPVYIPGSDAVDDNSSADDDAPVVTLDGDTPPRGVVRYDGVNVEIELNPLDWRQFYNSVIQPLVAKGANVNIRVSLNATHTEGMDLDFIELSIKESVVQISRTARVSVNPKQ
ncbi:MAG: ATP-binding protein [Chloroflexi bacterium]|nr:ATP-binding protein [Chloroflexota bacterium]